MQACRQNFKVGEAHPSEVGEAQVQFLLYFRQKQGRPGPPLPSSTYGPAYVVLWQLFSILFYKIYRTLAIINQGFYYFSVFSNVGFSFMFGGIPLKLGGYKTRAVITRARLIMARVRYIHKRPRKVCENSSSGRMTNVLVRQYRILTFLSSVTLNLCYTLD